jgi:uncharacterized membrane protein
MKALRRVRSTAFERLRHAMQVTCAVVLTCIVAPALFVDEMEGRPIRHFLGLVCLLAWTVGLPAGAALFYMGLFS